LDLQAEVDDDEDEDDEEDEEEAGPYLTSIWMSDAHANIIKVSLPGT
jgi:hypothetical protein